MREFFKLAFILMVICAVSAAALSFTHSKTWPLVVERRAGETFALLRELVPDAEDFDIIDDEVTYYVALSADGDILRVAFPGAGTGFNDDIRVIVVFTPEGLITDAKVLGHNDTPGYGTRLEDENFLEQFEGQPYDARFVLGDTIDNLTGATASAEGAVRGVRNSIDHFVSYFLGGGEDR